MANCCVSQDLNQQRILNDEINLQLRQEHRDAAREEKCLLFGPPGSGKTTFMKQMRILYGGGYSVEDKKEYCKYVFQNVIEAMQTLCKAMVSLQIEYSGAITSEENVKLILQTNTEDIQCLEAPLTGAIQVLWADSGIQEAWSRRREFSIPNTAKYFFENIQRISDNDYIPNEHDILRVNVPSTSVHEYKFEWRGVTYRMVDICGSMMDTMKTVRYAFVDNYVHYVFFSALDEYDEMILENIGIENKIDLLFRSRNTWSWYEVGGAHNGLDKSKTLFRTLLSSSRNDIILLLNKKDLFEKKFGTSGFSDYFQEFSSSSVGDAVEACELLLSQFHFLNPDPENIIYSHYLCATDTENVRFIYSALLDVMNSRRDWDYSNLV